MTEEKLNKFDIARQKYKPDRIKYLFVAETPPKITSDRFFYFEPVDRQDSLFIETIRCLYPDDANKMDVKTIRKNKKWFLEKFKNDGFYLVDSLDEPFETKYNSSKKISLIRQGQDKLLKKVKKLCNPTTKVILIAAPVFKANYHFLKTNKINVVNNELIDFPLFSGRIKFKEKLKPLI